MLAQGNFGWLSAQARCTGVEFYVMCGEGLRDWLLRYNDRQMVVSGRFY
jgi:hypothetical protein